MEKSLTSDYSRFLRISFACRVKPWEIIADRLVKGGWSLGWISAVDPEENDVNC